MLYITDLAVVSTAPARPSHAKAFWLRSGSRQRSAWRDGPGDIHAHRRWTHQRLGIALDEVETRSRRPGTPSGCRDS